MSFSLNIAPQPKREAQQEPIAKALAPGDQCSDAFLLTSVGKPTSCLFLPCTSFHCHNALIPIPLSVRQTEQEVDLCHPSPKPLETLSCPVFQTGPANTAKAALETKAVPEDVGVRAMLNSIGNSKAELCSGTSDSPRQD